MVRLTSRPILVLALAVVFLALAQPTFSAQSRSEARIGASQLDLLSQAKNMLSEVWRKIGCTIDPNGAQGPCISGQPKPGPESVPPASVHAPSNRPLRQIHGKIGCTIDPDGVARCVPNTSPPSIVSTPASLGIGCGVDPNGGTSGCSR